MHWLPLLFLIGMALTVVDYTIYGAESATIVFQFNLVAFAVSYALFDTGFGRWFRVRWPLLKCRHLGLHSGTIETWGPYVYIRCRYCGRLRHPTPRYVGYALEDRD